MMGSKKLVLDFFRAKHILFLRSHTSQGSRRFSVFNEFSEKVKEEAKRISIQQSLKELQRKADELKGVKDDLKARTKETTEQLYKRVDGVWTNTEAMANKVSANVKEKISAAKEEEDSGRSTTSSSSNAAADDHRSAAFCDRQADASNNQEEASTSGTFFSKFKYNVSSASLKVTAAFEKLREAKFVDLAKKGYDIIKDELNGSPNKRKHIQHIATSSLKVEKSDATDIVVVPVKQSLWSKKWQDFKNKVQNHPVYKRASGLSEPVVTKSQEIAEDMKERWETSGHPVVHKIQESMPSLLNANVPARFHLSAFVNNFHLTANFLLANLNETVFGETAAALSFKEIKRHDP